MKNIDIIQNMSKYLFRKHLLNNLKLYMNSYNE